MRHRWVTRNQALTSRGRRDRETGAQIGYSIPGERIDLCAACRLRPGQPADAGTEQNWTKAEAPARFGAVTVGDRQAALLAAPRAALQCARPSRTGRPKREFGSELSRWEICAEEPCSARGRAELDEAEARVRFGAVTVGEDLEAALLAAPKAALQCARPSRTGRGRGASSVRSCDGGRSGSCLVGCAQGSLAVREAEQNWTRPKCEFGSEL